MPRKRDRHETETTTEHLAASPRSPMDDDRPTELLDRAPIPELALSRQQMITGSTISEMMNNPGHKLSSALTKLVRRAKKDLPKAVIDPRASLMLRHDFEFEKRVGYQLKLKLFDDRDQCVEVMAELDQDGRAIRRGSMMSKLI